jgi:uncharacterized protein YodC (DUF2158 family)
VAQFNKGDVVVLKSGGPKMTVNNAGTDMTGELFVECVWFEGNQHRATTFHPEALEIAPASGGSVTAGPPRRM